MNNDQILEKIQSGYRSMDSTETVLIKFANELFLAMMHLHLLIYIQRD